MSEPLVPGLYELLITEGLRLQIDSAGTEGLLEEGPIEPDVAPRLLARHAHEILLRALRTYKGEGRLTQQLSLINDVLNLMQERAPKTHIQTKDRVAEPLSQLLSVLSGGQQRLEALKAPARPSLPLGTSDLLVNGPRDLRLGPELKRELASADRVDLLVSFLKWSGLRIVHDEMAAFLERRPGGLRVLTTTYMGATDQRAVEALVDLGARVRVSYDTRRTRLHAKAWLFSRDSGFSTAYVGSSNLSAPAILDGLEWNVRLTQVDNRAILSKFAATFQQYWDEGEFVDYDPDTFAAEVGRASERPSELVSIRVRPFAHQAQILDALATERERGHTRNLVVAATGTGKTIVAALDFQRLQHTKGTRSLLFVAHRVEILKQAREMFRIVLQDGSFGELLTTGHRPIEGKHVFAAVQSLHAERLETLRPDAYDMVIVDEFHHAAASTYTTLLEHLDPKILLGLTATPERTDGKSILGWFEDRVAAEIRLWSALDQGLLCPFHYFGVADGTDLKRLNWRGGYVDSELESLYTSHDARAALILKEVRRRVHDPARMRAVGFCVGIRHAEFMARKFRDSGIQAQAVHSRLPNPKDRDHFLRDFKAGKLQALFTVDLFNEGVDVPDIDTVLFLRPTQSATVFLQQLGRGLRQAPGKSCLTVLDFIGNAHRSFRFDVKFRALLGGTRHQIAGEVTQGFSHLPPGCSMRLDRQSEQWVLDNIRQSLKMNFRSLAEELRHSGTNTLAAFLATAQLDLSDIYRPGRTWSWTTLRRDAGLPCPEPGPNEAALIRALGRMSYLNDSDRLDIWRLWLQEPSPPKLKPIETWEGRLQHMLYVSLGHQGRPTSDIAQAFEELWCERALKEELIELLDILADRLRGQTSALTSLPNVPLRLHASYSLDEIMAGFGVERGGKIYRPRGQGVWWEAPCRTDLLFVTLDKTEGEYSPTTLYDDYPMSPTEFHWESQNSTTPTSTTGRRYIEGTSTVLLFVRAKKRDGHRGTMPYTLLGPAQLVSHEGERPMRIVWHLEHAMPSAWYQEVKVASG